MPIRCLKGCTRYLQVGFSTHASDVQVKRLVMNMSFRIPMYKCSVNSLNRQLEHLRYLTYILACQCKNVNCSHQFFQIGSILYVTTYLNNTLLISVKFFKLSRKGGFEFAICFWHVILCFSKAIRQIILLNPRIIIVMRIFVSLATSE